MYAASELIHAFACFPEVCFLDTTLMDPPPSSKVCETSFAQNPGKGGAPDLRKARKFMN